MAWYPVASKCPHPLQAECVRKLSSGDSRPTTPDEVKTELASRIDEEIEKEARVTQGPQTSVDINELGTLSAADRAKVRGELVHDLHDRGFGACILGPSDPEFANMNLFRSMAYAGGSQDSAMISTDKNDPKTELAEPAADGKCA